LAVSKLHLSVRFPGDIHCSHAATFVPTSWYFNYVFSMKTNHLSLWHSRY